MTTRNDPHEFALRTKKNLVFIGENARRGADVHPVTQLALSLLGLVIFPSEKAVMDAGKGLPLSDLNEDEWGRWTIELDNAKNPTTTVADVVRHVRNAISHARIRFSSDSQKLEDVEIVLEDAERKSSDPYWRARINGAHLHRFCLALLERLDGSAGE